MTSRLQAVRAVAKSRSRSSKDLGLEHISEELYDFIDQLWNAEANGKSAESLQNHLWLQNHSPATILSELRPSSDREESALAAHNIPYVRTGMLSYKLAQRDDFGR